MDTTALIVEWAAHLGVLGSALPDVLARSSTHFSAKEVTSESVQQFVTELKKTASHLFTPSQPAPGTPGGAVPPDWLSPSEKLTWARAHQPPAPVQRRPEPYTPTSAQLTSLEGKTATEKMTAYRGWQAEAQEGRA